MREERKKVYIYTRVSTAIQVDGYSLDAQRDKLTKYAEYQDMEVGQHGALLSRVAEGSGRAGRAL